MRDAFASVAPERLAGPVTRRPVPGVENLTDLIAFCGFHEAYHVGQIGFIRKQLGHSSIAGVNLTATQRGKSPEVAAEMVFVRR